MFSSPLPYVAVLVAVALLAWAWLSSRRQRALDAEERKRRYQQGLAWADAWDAFHLRVRAERDAFEAALTEPAFVISLLVGEDYPRYAVFKLKVSASYVRTVRLDDHDGYGETPDGPPPAETPKLFTHYGRISPQSFETEDEAEMWLYHYRNPHTRQTGFDRDGDETGPFGARDVELGS